MNCWRCGSNEVAEIHVKGTVTLVVGVLITGAVNPASKLLQSQCLSCGQVQHIKTVPQFRAVLKLLPSTAANTVSEVEEPRRGA